MWGGGTERRGKCEGRRKGWSGSGQVEAVATVVVDKAAVLEAANGGSGNGGGAAMVAAAAHRGHASTA